MKWPRLSETLDAVRDAWTCGACGRNERMSTEIVGVNIWREHDDDDEPLDVFIALCNSCADRIVEPHPRLYAAMDRHAPMPGAMPCCDDCKHRKGLHCAHPARATNGGPGTLRITFPEPMRCFVDGRRNGKRFGEVRTMYRGPCNCNGKEQA